jgi:hypothetical protein
VRAGESRFQPCLARAVRRARRGHGPKLDARCAGERHDGLLLSPDRAEDRGSVAAFYEAEAAFPSRSPALRLVMEEANHALETGSARLSR